MRLQSCCFSWWMWICPTSTQHGCYELHLSIPLKPRHVHIVLLVSPAMCRGCDRNEPGAYCSRCKCRQCCKANDCPQHFAPADSADVEAPPEELVHRELMPNPEVTEISITQYGCEVQRQLLMRSGIEFFWVLGEYSRSTRVQAGRYSKLLLPLASCRCPK